MVNKKCGARTGKSFFSKSLNHFALTLLFLLLANVMLAGTEGNAYNDEGYFPQVVVTGTVTDASTGDPLVGTTVTVQGTTIGVVTDLNGNYSITPPNSESVLVFTFVGYIEQDITVGGQTRIDVALEPSTEAIDEVVVVGYGIQTKSSVTGAIAQVTSEELADRTTSDIGQSVQGKLSGVQVLNTSGAPGASATFRIRGFSSAISAPDPLFVVDGQIVDNIDYLDPESIESIEVLKDAASASIYGAQAGNGVILLSTKQGKKGQAEVFYNSILAWSQPVTPMEMMNAAQFSEYWIESGRVGAASLQDADTDWQDVILETGFQQRHTFGASGGNERGTYYISGTYLANDGIVTGSYDTNDRITGQINGSYQINDWIKVGTTNSIERGYRHTVSENNFTGTGSAVGGAYYFDPTVPVYYETDADVPSGTNLLQAEALGENVLRNEDGQLYGQSMTMTSNLWNPLLMRNVQTGGGQTQMNEHWRTNLLGTAYAEITPLEGLVLTSRFGYGLSNSYSKVYNPPYYICPGQASGLPTIKAEMNNRINYTFENFVNYNTSIEQHDIAVMAGMQYSNTRNESIYGEANEITNLDPAFQSLDYVVGDASTRVLRGGDYYRSNVSYFGRLSYTFASKYILQANFRADAFDLSKLSMTNRWGFFPSVSAGWVLTEESFMQNVNRDVVSFLKLRGSYGIAGNINSLSSFAHTTSMSLTGSAYSLTNSGLLTAAAPSTRLPNPDLTWEETTQLDIGIDTRFLSNRLVFTADYYDKSTINMISSIAAPLVTGATSQTINRGEIRNWGLEFELGWNDRRGDFSYSVNANLTTINNEVIESPYESLRQAGGRNFFVPITYLEEGYPMWYIRNYIFKEFNATGQPVYYTAEELGTDDGKDFTGSGIPDFTYGLTIRLNYKNIDFTAFGQGVQGNEQYLCVYRPDLPVANMPAFVFEDRWTPTNTENALYPNANVGSSFSYAQSDFYVFDASYFKIKQIQLGYTLAPEMLRKVNIASLRIFGSVENMITFTDYPGNDPESMSATYGNSVGLDKVNYPTTRNFTFGLNVTF